MTGRTSRPPSQCVRAGAAVRAAEGMQRCSCLPHLAVKNTAEIQLAERLARVQHSCRSAPCAPAFTVRVGWCKPNAKGKKRDFAMRRRAADRTQAPTFRSFLILLLPTRPGQKFARWPVTREGSCLTRPPFAPQPRAQPCGLEAAASSEGGAPTTVCIAKVTAHSETSVT